MADYYSGNNRIIFTNNSIGRRQFKEVLGNILLSLIVSPSEFWLVSPWITDYELVDNRSGAWNNVEPSWGARKLSFSDLLIRAMESGCKVNLVTTKDPMNNAFIDRLQVAIPNNKLLNLIISENLHIKGLLTKNSFLAGSMNFTFSGAHRNEEQVTLSVDSHSITEAKLEFENRYGSIK